MKQTEKVHHIINKLPLFSSLSKAEALEMSQITDLLSLKRGEVLFSAGYPATHVYIVLSGCTKLVRSNPDGKERILHLLLIGEMFGAAVAVNGGFYPVSAIAMEQSLVMQIPTGVYQNFFLKHPKVGHILINQLGERIQKAHNDRIMSFDSVDKRVAAFLLDLLLRIKKVFGMTNRIPIPLTRQDIADCVGSTVETVIRITSSWSKQGWIDTQDKYIEIIQPSSLEKLIADHAVINF